MLRFIMPAILIGISITVFVMFTNPIYNDIEKLRTEVASYNEALDNFKTFDYTKEVLTAKESAINRDDLVKLQKLLPDNIDNIRLILEIEKIAFPYGMILKDVKYDAIDTATAKKNSAGGAVATPSEDRSQFASKDYGVWDLSFSTTDTYDDFLNFTRDLEKNLRIVDISSIQFSSNGAGGSGSNSNSASPESYQYSFKIKTYWLKN